MNASDEPVLPPVNSTTVPPGRRSPRASAPSIIASAMRSLYDPVGFDPSHLTNTRAAPSGTIRLSSMAGVLPIACRAVNGVDMGCSPYTCHQVALTLFSTYVDDPPGSVAWGTYRASTTTTSGIPLQR